MKRLAMGLALAALTTLATVPASARTAPKAAEAGQRDWSMTVVDTPAGWRMGNPDAPHALVEYLSYGCGHCAALAEEKGDLFLSLVKSGRMSLEIRPKTVFPWDTSTTTLARCIAPERRWAFTHDYYMSRERVMEGLNALRSNRAKAMQIQESLSVNPAYFMTSLAEAGNMYEVAARHGLPRAEAEACLNKVGAMEWADDRSAEADAAGIEGTPTLLLDDDPMTPSMLARIESLVAS